MRSTPESDIDAKADRNGGSAAIRHSKALFSAPSDIGQSILRTKGSKMLSSDSWCSSNIGGSISRGLEFKANESDIGLISFSNKFALYFEYKRIDKLTRFL